MNPHDTRGKIDLLERVGNLFTWFCFRILSVGPIPAHIAFIMDGNRRFAKRNNLEEGEGHKAGFSALISILKYCYQLGVRYVTVYAFSIDNFKRKPEEVQNLMNLMLEKIESLLQSESLVNQYGVRVYFIGDLKLLSAPVKAAAEKVMKHTAKNNKYSLLVCIAYTSSDEIVQAVEVTCNTKWKERMHSFHDRVEPGAGHESSGYESKNTEEKVIGLDNDKVFSLSRCSHCDTIQKGVLFEKNHVNEPSTARYDMEHCGKFVFYEHEESVIKLGDIEKHMYMAVAPDPDILIRTSGEMRMSNFLLWQTSACPLYSPQVLWPEIGLWHLVYAVLIFQKNFSFLEKKKKQL